MSKKNNWYKRKRRENKKVTEKVSNSKDSTKSRELIEAEKQIDSERARKDDEEIESVMFVPCTPNSELVKRLRETDRRFREGSDIKRIKFVERRGRSLQDILVSGNPWSDQKCGRTKCMICQRETGNMGECMRENALYKITCQ